MEKLEARIRNHDREIEKMCNFHYQGFVDSITELLKVRGEAQKLKVRQNPVLTLPWATLEVTSGATSPTLRFWDTTSMFSPSVQSISTL